MSQNKVLLGYWAIRGLGQPIRMLLEYTGTPYEEKRYVQEGAPSFSIKDWTDVKFTLGLDFPNLPYLFDGNLKLTQSSAILRHIGRKHNLCGETEEEKALVDMALYEAYDLKEGYVNLVYDPNFASLRGDYLANVTKPLERFEKFLNGKEWLAGQKLSIADFMLYEMVDEHTILEPTILDKFPNLQNYRKRFAALPQIAAYMKSDRFIDRPLNNTVAQFK
eukprot:TRINITY_DN910_c0_g1_i1.p1 TRINITY_DN910_c0_g1~~TRINITY_DN910_c0_g1_i1.p1  ORF type:complete len:220 (-),score=69.16 TRINITY_DN910_c0_g1_i1:31-690(-)